MIIVGTGPAGAAAALSITRHSAARVLLISAGSPQQLPQQPQQQLQQERWGETLTGAARPVLRDLGLWDSWVSHEQQMHPRTLGLASVWGSAEEHRRDAFADPQGGSWRIDRGRLERWLLAAATGRGCALVEGRAWHLQRAADARSWTLHLAGRELSGRYLIDASGRRGALARLLGQRAQRTDALVCDSLAFDASAGRAQDLDGFSLVEAMRDGWFFGSRLPDGRRWLGFHTDADLASREVHGERGLLARLERSTLMRRFIGAARPLVSSPQQTPRTHRVAAWSARLPQVAGPGWAAVGDAACCFDPLASQGLFHALATGLRIGQLLAQAGPMVHWGEADLQTHAQEIERIWAAYGRHHRTYHASEARWPEAPFWARRCAPRAAVQPAGMLASR